MSARFDVVVVGAGVVGLSTARALVDRGARVCVIDAHEVGGLGSRAAAGVAVPSTRLLDDPETLALATDGKRFLDEDLPALKGSGQGLARGMGILRLFGEPEIDAQLAAAAERVPEQIGHRIDAEQAMALEPVLARSKITGAWLCETAYVVDVEGYLNAMLVRLAGRATLRLGEPVDAVDEGDDGVRVRTFRGELVADQLVVAAGAWSGRLPGLPPLPVRPLRGQMCLVDQPGVAVSRVLSGKLGYLAPWTQGQIVVGATEEDAGYAAHPTPDGALYLAAAVARIAPTLRSARLGRFWAGLRSVGPTHRPLIGRYPGTRRTWIGSAHAGMGIISGGVTGQLLAEGVSTGSAPRAEPFDPLRALG